MFLIFSGLFLTSFIAATILPAQSEALLALLITQNPGYLTALVLVASTGNILGSIVNYYLGWSLERWRGHRWFPVSEKQMQQAQAWYQRYGFWTLFASWVPIIGDPLTVIAGTMREPLWRFTMIVTAAKTLRYCAVAAIALGLF